MASGIGVTYELEFVIKDKKARQAIEEMAKRAVKLVKTLDRVTLSRATGALKKFNNELKFSETAVQKIARYNAVLGKNVKNPYQNVSKGAESAAKSVEKLVKKIQTGFFYRTGAYLFQQGQQAWSDFSNIDFDLRAASAKTGGFGKDYKELFNLSAKVGGETRFTNADVAKALNAGATLGISKEELKAILPVTAQLAQAFNTDIPFAMEITKMHMNTYALTQEKANMVTDMLASTAKNSAADLERLAEGFKYVGGQAKALDIPLEQVYAVLGKMNDSGFTGSTAGTAFNNFLVNLGNIKKRESLEELIGKVTDEKGNLLELSNILERIKVVTDKMGNADKAGVFQTIFGIRGSKTVNTFMNQGIDGLKELQEKIKNSSGLTQKMSKYMMSGPAGALEELLSTLESTFQSTFQMLSPLIVPVSIALRGVAQAIMLINQKVPFLGQFMGIIASFGVGNILIQYMSVKMTKLIPIIQDVVKNLFSLKGLLNVGIAVGLIILFRLFEKWMQYLSENEEASKQWEQALRFLKSTFENLADLIVSVVKALFGFEDGQKGAEKATDSTVERLNELNKTLFNVNLKIQEMRRWVERNNETVKKWGKAFLVLSGVIVIIKALTTAVAIFNAVSAANPYVLAAIGIIATLAQVYFTFTWLYKHVEWFRNAVNWIISQIKEHWTAVIGWIIAGPFGLWIGGLIDLYKHNEDFRKLVDTAWETIKTVIKGAADIAAKAIDGITNALKEALGALKDLLNGDWEALGNRLQKYQIVKNANSRMGDFGTDKKGKNAVGTDYFQGWKYGNMTTIDENGDELAFLPNGTMIVKNQTSREMLNTMKSINKKTGNSSESKTVVQNNNININVSGGKEAANELIKELEILGIV